MTGRSEHTLEEHFDVAYDLENTMRNRGRSLPLIDGTRQKLGCPIYIRQQEPLGLGHAVWCAREIVGDEPFAMLLPDELMVGSSGFIPQMVAAYEAICGNIVGGLEVSDSDTDKYGIISLGKMDGRMTEVVALVEKPAKGAGCEIQLTDAMVQLIGKQPFHGLTFDGSRYKAGYIKANLALVLARADIRPSVRALAKDLLGRPS